MTDDHAPQSAPTKMVGERIRQRRKQAGLSQTQLGALIGYKTMAISQIETGQQNISIRQLFLIANALQVAPEILIKR